MPETINDAQAIYDALKDTQFSAYPQEQTHLLLGKGATPNAILERLAQFATISTPQSVIIFYFSGHGWRQSAEQRGLVCHDKTLLLADQLQQKINAIPANLVVIFDTCYAGGMASTKPNQEQEQEQAPPAEFLKKLEHPHTPSTHLHSRLILSSSRDDEKSWLKKNGHSYYTQTILEELKRVDQEKPFVMGSDLIRVTNEVSKVIENNHHAKQTPWNKMDGSDPYIALRPYKRK